MGPRDWRILGANALLGLGGCFALTKIIGILISGRGTILLVLLALAFLFAIFTAKNKNAFDLVIWHWPIDPNADRGLNPDRAPEYAFASGFVLGLLILVWPFSLQTIGGG